MDACDNMLALLESLMPEPAENVARKIADDFRQRRVEKGLTRSDIAKKSRVSIANITRFEQKALISLSNLIELAIALGYNYEIKNIFATPKYSTMEELLQIRKKQGKTRAYKRRKPITMTLKISGGKNFFTMKSPENAASTFLTSNLSTINILPLKDLT